MGDFPPAGVEVDAQRGAGQPGSVSTSVREAWQVAGCITGVTLRLSVLSATISPALCSVTSCYCQVPPACFLSRGEFYFLHPMPIKEYHIVTKGKSTPSVHQQVNGQIMWGL